MFVDQLWLQTLYPCRALRRGVKTVLFLCEGRWDVGMEHTVLLWHTQQSQGPRQSRAGRNLSSHLLLPFWSVSCTPRGSLVISRVVRGTLQGSLMAPGAVPSQGFESCSESAMPRVLGIMGPASLQGIGRGRVHGLSLHNLDTYGSIPTSGLAG